MKLVSPDLQTGGRRNNYVALLGPWLLLAVLVGGIAALFAVVTVNGRGVASGYEESVLFYCDSNSRIRFNADNTNDGKSPYWDDSLFLSVTMGFHGLSFVQAKAIDIGFDLVVGRGSQILAALATYPIFRRAVLRSMEVRNLSLALLLPFFMERLSFFTLWSMVANMRSSRRPPSGVSNEARKSGSRVDWRIVLVLLTGCYILSLPTWMSAMTSYQARSAPHMPSKNGSEYLSADDLGKPDLIIEYGYLIGRWKNYPVYYDTDSELANVCSDYDDALGDVRTLWESTWTSNYSSLGLSGVGTSQPESLYSQSALSEVLFNEYRDSLPLQLNITDQNEPSLWSFTLWPRNVSYSESKRTIEAGNAPRPPLITGTIVIYNSTFHTKDFVPLVTRNREPRGNSYYYQDSSLFVLGNETFTGEDVEETGKCLPADGYIWGFSSLMLFTFCMISIVIAIFLMILHYDAYCNSSADRYKLYYSPYRDVLDLAAELSAHYGSTEVDTMPAKTLDKAMAEDPAVARLETETLHATRMARWRQQRDASKGSKRASTWDNARKRSKAGDEHPSDAEESLMAIGRDAQVPEIEMGKLPAKVVTRSVSQTHSDWKS